jgi:hypothetical protein
MIQLLDIDRQGSAIYRYNGRMLTHHMRLTTAMIKEANEDFEGSLADAKIGTHILKTIEKFHEKRLN